jgi:HEAT repeat protein
MMGLSLPAAPPDRFLWFLAGAGLGLFLMACGFAVYAVFAGARSHRRARRDRAIHESWTAVILRVLSGEDGPPVLLRLVEKNQAVAFSHFLLQFARRLRGPERRVLGTLAAPFLDGVAQGLADPHPEKRARAVYALGLLAPFRFNDSIREALDDPASAVAVTAAFVLLTGRSADDARTVLDRLDRFGHWDTGLLSFLLGQVGVAIAGDLRVLLEDRSRGTRARQIAAQSLVRLQDPFAGDCAARVLTSETDPEVLSAALGILKNQGRPEHLEAIRGACAAPFFFVRAAALTALGRVGGPGEEAFLRDYFDTPNPWIAAHAAEALKRIGALTFLRAVASSPHPRAVLARQVLEAA